MRRNEGSKLLVPAGLLIALTGFVELTQAAINSLNTIRHIEIQLSGKPSNDQSLDRLFADLLKAPDERQAQVIEEAIWKLWFHSENEVISRGMVEAMRMRREGDYQTALGILTGIIDTYPEYTEAWNQRATVYYLTGKFEQSLHDITETLSREPRHFGALSGRAAIFWDMGLKKKARLNLRQAVRIYPFLRDRHMLAE